MQSAQLDGPVLFLAGSINTTTNAALRIEFFSSPTNEGEGQHFLGFILVETGSLNTVPFSAAFSSALVQPGDFITATATDLDGSTSEFSLALEVI